MTDVYELDGAKLRTLPEAHAYLRETLALPAYYGENLDALFDCLTERTNETLLFVTHAQLAHPKLRQVLTDAMAANEMLTVIEEETET